MVPPGEEAAFLAPLPLRTLPGIGPRTEQRLTAAGLATVGDLAALDDDGLRAVAPGRMGQDLRRRARGIDPRPVAAVPAERISISNERTFERDVSDPGELESIGRAMADDVALTLRRRGRAARTVTVKLRYADFRTVTRGQTVPVATDDAAVIWDTARALLRRALSERDGSLPADGRGGLGIGRGRPARRSSEGRVAAMTGPVTASGERVGRAIGAARAALEARAAEVDDLNVFPVADGDTGTNMLATAAAVERAAAATAGLPRAERCAALARAALVGARGNSGMILSQLVRGAAEVLGAGDGPVDGPTVARALRGASRAADAAVRRPVEGTMLTVARRAAEAAEESGAPDAETVLAAALAGGRRGVGGDPGAAGRAARGGRRRLRRPRRR